MAGRKIISASWVFFVLTWFLIAERVEARVVIPPPRFPFTIDPKTPLKDLLPVPPDLSKSTPPFLISKLANVPEVLFQKPLERVQSVPAGFEKKTPEEQRKIISAHQESLQKAMKKTAHGIAKINHLNQKGTDHFLKVLLEQRPDLAGLPFVMGDACRMSKEHGRLFAKSVDLVRGSRKAGFQPLEKKLTKEEPPFDPEEVKVKWYWEVFHEYWERVKLECGNIESKGKDPQPAVSSSKLEVDQKFWDRKIGKIMTRALIEASMQMLAIESAKMRVGLAKFLGEMELPEATRALTRLAIFSFEQEVREAAINALKTRPAKDSTDILLYGLRYPWPAVAEHATQAMVKLERKDLVPQLVDFLDEPDPRAPAEKQVNGKKVSIVRELVRLNHHHNCLLCHAPGNTPDITFNGHIGQTDVMTGAVPIPGQELPSPSQGYLMTSPDILVRADVTYLRQDFSLLMPVENAAPWPNLQRFDFLVRTLTLTSEEEKAYQELVQKRGPGFVSDHHRAAVTALRALTGKSAEPTASAWRKTLELAP